jgi:hypothetical protein
VAEPDSEGVADCEGVLVPLPEFVPERVFVTDGVGEPERELVCDEVAVCDGVGVFVPVPRWLEVDDCERDDV